MSRLTISEIESYLITEIGEKQEFINTVEDLIYKDYKMSPESLYNLAEYLGYNYVYEEMSDYLLEQSAKAGYPPAMGDQAFRMLRQAHSRREFAAVIRLARKAAKAGFSEAYGLIGYMYSTGSGVTKNTKIANRYSALAGINNPYQRLAA